LSTRRPNRRVPITEVDQFLADVLPRQIEAEKAICNGDPAPRLAMWSSKNPVTLFGADATKQGAEEVRQFFHLVASWFANCTAYRFELVAAEVSGDLAYTIGFEHVSASFRGGPEAPISARVTHLYRRENGEWMIVHRHADRLLDNQA
jgi:ketosteroid isomerase-like protein